jgi:hypothetical protein
MGVNEMHHQYEDDDDSVVRFYTSEGMTMGIRIDCTSGNLDQM